MQIGKESVLILDATSRNGEWDIIPEVILGKVSQWMQDEARFWGDWCCHKYIWPQDEDYVPMYCSKLL